MADNKTLTSHAATSHAAHQRFTRLVALAAVATFLMITIGAITRVTESGMGCGTHWPLCNGRIIPEFQTPEEIIEKGHRLFALLVGFFTVLVGWRAYKQYRDQPGIFFPAMGAVFLFFVQSGLGAITVWMSNQWVSVLLHMGNAMLLFSCFLVTWAVAKHSQDIQRTWQRLALRLPPLELILTLILTFLVAMVGAAVAGNTALKACVGWPLCGAEIWPSQQGPLQVLNMTHRLVVGGLGILLVMILWQLRSGANPVLRRPILWAFGMYLAQSALGALIVLVNQREFLTSVRALHVTFAAATWAALVIASTISWLQQSPVRTTTPQPAVAFSGTTSS
jgi:heme A synthase